MARYRLWPCRTAPALLAGILFAAVLGLTLLQFHDRLPALLRILVHAGDGPDRDYLLLFHSHIPRLVVSLLAGAMLGLSGALFQQLLQNPIAEPTTLGVSAGAHSALAIALVTAPSLLAIGRELVAIIGSVTAFILVLLIAGHRRLDPVTVVLAGLIVTLTAGSLSGVLVLMNHDYLGDLFVWQSGSLVQNGWRETRLLAPSLAAGWLLSGLLARSIGLLSLGDEASKSIGLSLNATRAAGLCLATFLAAMVVSAVGVVGFIGLVAPAAVRFAGARTFAQRLVWSPIIGAGMLCLCDQLSQRLFPNETMPTGIITAMVGAPMMLALIWRTRVSHHQRDAARPTPRPSRSVASSRMILFAVIAVCLAVASVTIGRGPDGWHVATGRDFLSLVPWRLPRSLGAFCGGAMLAMAGVLLQRLMNNPMAAPEVLGASSGACAGVILILMIFSGTDLGSDALMFASAAGAFVAILLLLSFNWRTRFSSELLLLSGIAVGTFGSALSAFFLNSGSDRTGFLLSWMAGSTYRVTMSEALSGAVATVIAMVCLPLLARWLRILPLGGGFALSIGVHVVRARAVLLLAAACLTGIATVIVGPLSFVGLMAPHMVRLGGIRDPAAQIAGSAIVGGSIMLAADWIGRTIAFPWQIPAGLIASLCSGPYLFLLMRRSAGQ